MENRVESSHEPKLESGPPTRVKTTLTKLLDIIQRVLYSVIGLLVLLMTVANVLQVFYRYAARSITLAEEVLFFHDVGNHVGWSCIEQTGAHSTHGLYYVKII
jgi:hypothetical protein